MIGNLRKLSWQGRKSVEALSPTLDRDRPHLFFGSMGLEDSFKRPKVQAGEITYELHSLGWKAFQTLCVTITGEIWGQTVQSFFDSHDGGRDGAFSGIWKPKSGAVYEGAFTAQCKFSAKADRHIQLADLNDELEKAKRLAARGLADNYFLFTNARLTGANEEEIRAAFLAGTGIKKFAAYGADRICLFIRESSRLRMLVPRVYGLGDLSQILDERAYAQAQEILNAMGEDLAKFVITGAYQRSAKALIEHGFVLLLGEPACGKSSIAAALALGAVDEWRCSTLKVRNAAEFVTHSNPHEPKQFFWVDDAFGATQFDASTAASWNQTFAHMQAAIRRGARVLFTSRDYIYNSAKQFLKESALPVLRESQVVIQVEQLTTEEREQILYNHIRLGHQKRSFKTQLKPFLKQVAARSRFSPEIARRLGDPLFTKKLEISQNGLADFVDRPVELLCEVIQTLDAGSRSALALIFMRGGLLPVPISITSEEQQAISLLGGTSSQVNAALKALNGSLVLQALQNGSYSARFKHPTVRDAFATLVSKDHGLLDIYLTGTPLETLFLEVSCGDLSMEGVKVIVPQDRYHMLIGRIQKNFASGALVEPLHTFLSFRCEKAFLDQFIKHQPDFIGSLKVWSYMRYVSDVKVLRRLHQFNLLPEPDRLRVVSIIRELAVDTPDSGFLHDSIAQLLTTNERAEILQDVEKKLIPKLDKRVSSWGDSWDHDEDPADHFDELIDTLDDYKSVFAEDLNALSKISIALEKIGTLIDEMRSEQPQEPDLDEYRGAFHGSSGDDSRSVFDDVDQ